MVAENKVLGNAVKKYSSAIVLGGPGCKAAQDLRKLHEADKEFLMFFDAFDTLYLNLEQTKTFTEVKPND